MSNQVVGSTYGQIMEKVIAASLNDFEESGVDQQTLQELKETWQRKLTGLHVAHFPWDPAPAPAVSNPPTVPSNAPKSDASPMPSSASTPQPPNYGGARIKQESTAYEAPLPGSQVNGLTSGLNQGLAQQRAVALLQRNYGQQADAALAAGGLNQYGLALPGQPRQAPPTGLQLPGQGQPHQQSQQPQPQQTPRLQAPPVAQRQPHAYSQIDGANDSYEAWSTVLASRSRNDDASRLAADYAISQQLRQDGADLSSGLMVPLDKKLKSRTNLKRPSRVVAGGSLAHGQLDGLFEEDDNDKEVKDDEAINSDLDDPEDDLDKDQDNGDDMMDTMLCTYDKVQRVKNKWKCTLKDGVLTTGGKDYLFHKATGEFEW